MPHHDRTPRSIVNAPHHNRTPQSVLNAPHPDPVVVYAQGPAGSKGNAPFTGPVQPERAQVLADREAVRLRRWVRRYLRERGQ